MAKKPTKFRFFKWLFFIGFFFLLIGISFFGSIYYGLWGEVPTKRALSDLSQLESSQVYDKNNKLIGKYYVTDREAIKFDDLPQHLIDALIATEDKRFYEHNGIDEKSLPRVFIKSILLRNKSTGGGSTLTLQLAKNLYGRPHYPYFGIVINKLRESIVARRLEKLYSKNEILTLYLNTVPFSGDTYGVESASHKFFNTKAKNLDLSQAATLIGTLQANHTFNPRLFPEESQNRRNIVLLQMAKSRYITKELARKTMEQDLEINYKNYASTKSLAPYFLEQIKRQAGILLEDKKYYNSEGEKYDIEKDGLKIHTTLDSKLQEYAEESMKEHMKTLQNQFERYYAQNPPWSRNSTLFKQNLQNLPVYKSLEKKGWSEEEIQDSLNRKKEMELFDWEENDMERFSIIDSLEHSLKFLNTGLVSLDPKSGAVLAYVGGIDYRYFQFDHVLQSRRQVGSIFKPFVYTTALENGLTPCDYFSAREVTYADHDNWRPKNADKNIDPEMNFSMAEALKKSMNTVAVKVLREAGIKKAIQLVHKMGIEDEIEENPSIVLGTSAHRLIDMAKAYSTYLNDSKPVNPYFIERIENKKGDIIFEADFQETDTKALFSDTTRQQMLEMLKGVVNEGTARRLRNVYGFQNDIAGKTGTTQDNTDGWFVGLLPNLVTVTWVGHDNYNIKIGNTALGQGANSALPIFAGMLQRMNQDTDFNKNTHAKFPVTPSKVLAEMDCDPEKEDGFLKRIFKGKEEKKDFKKTEKQQKRAQRKRERQRKRKNKKGFFRRIFGGKDK